MAGDLSAIANVGARSFRTAHHDLSHFLFEECEKKEFSRGGTECLSGLVKHPVETAGITVAYFTDESAIAAWRNHVQHRAAQKLGKERWYSHYEVRVARVERSYSGPADR